MMKLKSKAFKQKFAWIFLHGYFLSALNVLMLVLLYSSLKTTWVHLNPENHFDEAVELWEGFGTILMGFGVILEERVSLQHMVGFQGKDSIEEVCHDFGVIFVVLGVVIEVFAWLVKIPNSVFDTYEIEIAMLHLAAAAAAIGGWFQIKFQLVLFQAARVPNLNKS